MKPSAAVTLTAVLAFSLCHAGELIPWGTDSAVLTAALSYFAKTKDSAQYNPNGYVGVSPQTQSLASSWSDDDYYRMFSTLKHPAPRSALASYLQRNRQSHPIGALSAADQSLRVEKRDQLSDEVLLGKAPFRTYVHLQMPGYSSDGAWAFVTFDFLWSIHGAEAMYVLKREGGSWVVVSTEYRYAV